MIMFSVLHHLAERPKGRDPKFRIGSSAGEEHPVSSDTMQARGIRETYLPAQGPPSSGGIR